MLYDNHEGLQWDVVVLFFQSFTIAVDSGHWPLSHQRASTHSCSDQSYWLTLTELDKHMCSLNWQVEAIESCAEGVRTLGCEKHHWLHSIGRKSGELKNR